jgi:hypothetical protein
MRFLDRVLFGREGVERSEAADRRLQAAFRERERGNEDLETARRRLQEVVRECESRTRRLTSDPPPVVRFVLAEEELNEDNRGSRP